MEIPTFTSRAQAFDYMFTMLCSQGEDIMEAAKKAESFASIVAKNRALPEAPKNFIGQCVDMAKQVAEVKRDYPEIWEVASGVLGGIVGVISGVKVANAEDETPAEPLDFENMEGL